MLKQKGTKENKCKTKYRGKEIIEQLVLEAKKYLQKRKKKKKTFQFISTSHKDEIGRMAVK